LPRFVCREWHKTWPKRRWESIEAVRKERTAVINESVDLLYNLIVLSSELGISACEIWAEMNRRRALFGMAEKFPKEAGSDSTASACD